MKNLYCIYDKVGNSSSDPFVAANDGLAIRFAKGFLNRMLETNANIVSAADFSLYRIGTFTDDNLPAVSEDNEFICGLDSLVPFDTSSVSFNKLANYAKSLVLGVVMNLTASKASKECIDFATKALEDLQGYIQDMSVSSDLSDKE